jgi:hypothetical protein
MNLTKTASARTPTFTSLLIASLGQFLKVVEELPSEGELPVSMAPGH